MSFDDEAEDDDDDAFVNVRVQQVWVCRLLKLNIRNKQPQQQQLAIEAAVSSFLFFLFPYVYFFLFLSFFHQQKYVEYVVCMFLIDLFANYIQYYKVIKKKSNTYAPKNNKKYWRKKDWGFFTLSGQLLAIFFTFFHLFCEHLSVLCLVIVYIWAANMKTRKEMASHFDFARKPLKRVANHIFQILIFGLIFSLKYFRTFLCLSLSNELKEFLQFLKNVFI